ncbi:cupin domain-containing protein [Telluria sp. B2]
MLIHADFSRRAVVAPDQYAWTASPQGGVERVMLDRIGAEKARATSIVRYAPGSRFPAHTHPGGEEILVLSGVFSDEHGDYPEGWYLRNPPGSAHTPSSREGATIFVKLRQMTATETAGVRIDTRAPSSWRQQGARAVCPLFAAEGQEVSLQRVEANGMVLAEPVAGAEMLVLAGELVEDDARHACGTWMRLPAGAYPALRAGPQGATLYLRTGAPAAVPAQE